MRTLTNKIAATILISFLAFLIPPLAPTPVHATTLKTLPEINYNETEDDLLFWNNGDFTSVQLSDAWTGSTRSSTKSVLAAAESVEEWPSITMLAWGNGYDKRWKNYAGFSIDLKNPNPFELPMQIRFFDNEGDKYYNKVFTLHANMEITIEVYMDELEDAGVNPVSIDSLTVQVLRNGTFDLYVDNLFLIEKSKGSIIDTFRLSGVRAAANFDKYTSIVALQGLANRTGPRLMVLPDDNPSDENWWNVLHKPGKWLAGYEKSEITSYTSLIDTYIDEINGVVIWDPSVPATLNVASTMAGVVRAIPVQYDTTPGSPYHYIVMTKGKTVLKDLRGMFTGTGTIPDINQPSTGSPKTDAYLWAKMMFLDTRLVNPSILGQMGDSYTPSPSDPQIFVVDRDIVIMKKGFFFDLSPWPNESASDEPGQPAGVDYDMFTAIMDSAWDQISDRSNIHVIGAINFFYKYMDVHTSNETEWQSEKVLTERHGVLITSEGSSNGSFYIHGKKIDQLVQNPPPALVPLENKTYVLLQQGDNDGLYQIWGHWYWEQKTRKDNDRWVPISWSFNPGVALYSPEYFRHFYETKSPFDYYVAGPGGLGYAMPYFMDSDMIDHYTKESKDIYSRLGYKVANFNIEPDLPSTAILNKFSTFAVDGYGHKRVASANWYPNSNPLPANQLRNRMAINYLFDAYGNTPADAAESIKNQARDQFGSPPYNAPKFLNLRLTDKTVAYIQDTAEYLLDNYAEYDWEFVDPYTYYYLLRESLGGSNQYRVTFVSHNIPSTAMINSSLTVSAGIRNDGADLWPASGDYYIAYKLIDATNTVVSEQWYSPGVDVYPGSVVNKSHTFTLPNTAGNYKVKIDIVRNGVTWFEEAYNIPLERDLRIMGAQDQLPEHFLLLNPIKGSRGNATKPVFSWEPSFGASSYNLVVSTNSDLSNPIINETGLTSTSYTPASVLTHNTTYYWRVTAVNANGSVEDRNAVISFRTATNSGDYVQRVNAGGSAYTDSNGKVWAADQAHTPGSWGYTNGRYTDSTADNISLTSDPSIYQSDRNDAGWVGYAFDITEPGYYMVREHFAEIAANAVNQRVFHHMVQGEYERKNYDIYAETGHDAAQVIEYPSSISSDSISIMFEPTETALGPKVSAIEVKQLSRQSEVDLSAYYNMDGISSDDSRSDGDLDGAGHTLSAEVLPDRYQNGKYNFKFGSKQTLANNIIKATGQTIILPQGNQSNIQLAGFSTSGIQNGTFRIHYTDSSYSDTALTFQDWLGVPGSHKILEAFNHYHSADRDKVAVNRIYVYELSLDRLKTVSSIELPNNTHIKLLAMTLN